MPAGWPQLSSRLIERIEEILAAGPDKRTTEGFELAAGSAGHAWNAAVGLPFLPEVLQREQDEAIAEMPELREEFRPGTLASRVDAMIALKQCKGPDDARRIVDRRFERNRLEVRSLPPAPPGVDLARDAIVSRFVFDDRPEAAVEFLCARYGVVANARDLPPEVQEDAYRRGMIPRPPAATPDDDPRANALR